MAKIIFRHLTLHESTNENLQRRSERSNKIKLSYKYFFTQTKS